MTKHVVLTCQMQCCCVAWVFLSHCFLTTCIAAVTIAASAAAPADCVVCCCALHRDRAGDRAAWTLRGSCGMGALLS